MYVKQSMRRLAENEAVFRQRNEQVQHDVEMLNTLAVSEGDEQPIPDEMVLHFYCECSDENCVLRTPISLDEYADIHKNRKHFVVVPGHEVVEIEKVVAKTPSYYEVEKLVLPPENPDTLHKTSVNNV